MQTLDTFIIAGGGIGGLATALALQKNGFSSQIYERDRDFNCRRQGYSLTIQIDGFKALEKLGVAGNVRKMGVDSIISGTSTYNNLGEIIFSKPKKLNNSHQFNNDHHFNNFAVPRQSLREYLMNELTTDTVHWNKEITRYEAIPDDPHHVRIYFSDNTSTIGRALIGCDGVRSSIRRQMLGDDLNYLGVWAINGISPHYNNQFLLNQTVQIIDGKSRLFVKPFSIDKCMWQFTFKVPRNDEIYDQLSQNDMEGLLNRAKYATKDWYKPIAKLISDTQPCDVRAGPIFDRDPLDIINKDVAYVTMLGDAVHPMSPFKGQGANQALIDAVSLVECLVKHKGEDRGVENAFFEFETEMLKRSRRYILGSRFAVEFLHTENALLSENMSQFVSGNLILQ
jgi:2-polyprenyl-6-methoxyphenol hydroxylase-like FAD-dependent oxidoreductase